MIEDRVTFYVWMADSFGRLLEVKILSQLSRFLWTERQLANFQALFNKNKNNIPKTYKNTVVFGKIIKISHIQWLWMKSTYGCLNMFKDSFIFQLVIGLCDRLMDPRHFCGVVKSQLKESYRSQVGKRVRLCGVGALEMIGFSNTDVTMYVYWRYALCHTLHMYIYIYALYILRWQFLDVLQMLSRSFRPKTCRSSIPSGSLVCLVKRSQQTMQSTLVRGEKIKLPVPFPKKNENCQLDGF